MHKIGIFSKVSTALAKAKSESKKSLINGRPLHEIFVELSDEDEDTLENWAYRKGKLVYHNKG